MNYINSLTYYLKLTICFCIAFVAFNDISGQIKNIGLPFINNYHREDYNAGTQSWAITQDENGIMYFANNNGMLEYNGNEWTVHPFFTSRMTCHWLR